MPFLVIASGGLVALAVAVLITPIIKRVAWKKRCLDRPDTDRKQHDRPTPTLGGLAIVAGTLAGGAYLLAMEEIFALSDHAPSLGLWAGALVVLGAGVYDDLRVLNPKAKFTLQVVAAYILLHAGYRIDVAGFPGLGDDPYQLALFSLPLTIVWIVGVINAVNLLDGLDGLAGGMATVALASFAAIFGLQGDAGAVAGLLVIIGAVLGFLMYNFNPATIFMGDSGSLFLGYMLAAYSLDLTAGASGSLLTFLIPVIVLGVPITDTTVAIVRRLVSGKGIFGPDGDHVHHRLRALFSHRGAVFILYGVALWFGVAAFLMASLPAYIGYGIFAVAVITTGIGLWGVGYLRTQALARSLRYRYIKQERQRRRTAEVDGKEPAHTRLTYSIDEVNAPGGDGGLRAEPEHSELEVRKQKSSSSSAPAGDPRA